MFQYSALAQDHTFKIDFEWKLTFNSCDIFHRINILIFYKLWTESYRIFHSGQIRLCDGRKDSSPKPKAKHSRSVFLIENKLSHVSWMRTLLHTLPYRSRWVEATSFPSCLFRSFYGQPALGKDSDRSHTITSCFGTSCSHILIIRSHDQPIHKTWLNRWSNYRIHSLPHSLKEKIHQ